MNLVACLIFFLLTIYLVDAWDLDKYYKGKYKEVKTYKKIKYPSKLKMKAKELYAKVKYKEKEEIVKEEMYFPKKFLYKEPKYAYKKIKKEKCECCD